MLISLSALQTAFHDVVETVRGEVGRTASMAQKLDDLAIKATGNVNDAKAAIDNVEKLAEEALRGAASASEALQEVTHAATLTASSAAEAAEASSTTSKLSGDVFNLVHDFVGGLEGVGAAVAQNSEGMGEVGSSVESITEFVGTIKSIASQTNLLALNAAIEAARAGEAGRGFAVVAEEVRKLAEESNVASQHVAEMIEHLQSGTASAIKSTQDASRVISGIVDKAQKAQNDLKSTLDQIDRVNNSVQTIAAAAEQQAVSSGEIAHSTESVQSSVKNVVNEMEVVDRASVGTVSVVEDVAAESERLVGIARNLEKIMEGFKTTGGGTKALAAK
jgi:methyl-accepting chemotaxis protein